MNIRRLLLDVDKASSHPSLIELAAAIDRVDGIEALNIIVTELDIETMDLDITRGSPVIWTGNLVIGGILMTVVGFWLHLV